MVKIFQWVKELIEYLEYLDCILNKQNKCNQLYSKIQHQIN